MRLILYNNWFFITVVLKRVVSSCHKMILFNSWKNFKIQIFIVTVKKAHQAFRDRFEEFDEKKKLFNVLIG